MMASQLVSESLRRAEIWTDVQAGPSAGTVKRVRTFVAKDLREFTVDLRRDGNHALTIVALYRSLAAQAADVTKIVREELKNGMVREWPITAVVDEDSPQGTLRTITGAPLLHQWAASKLVLDATPGLPNPFRLQLVDVKPSEIFDTFILPTLTDYGIGYVSRGAFAVDDPIPEFVGEWAGPLELVRAIEEKTSCLADLQYVSSTSYEFVLLGTPLATPLPVDIRERKNLRNINRATDALEFANAIYGKGRTRQDGVAATLQYALWEVSNVPSSTSVDLVDPAGGPSPVGFDDQFNGFGFPGVATEVQQTITGYTTPPDPVITVASTTGILLGDRIRIQGNPSGWQFQIYYTTVLAVTGTTITPDPSVFPLNDPSWGATIFVGGTVTRLATSRMINVDDSAKLNATTGRLTLASAHGKVAGDLVELRANTSGDFIRYLTNPASLALYPPRYRYRVLPRPDLQGDRNAILNGRFAEWTSGTAAPDNWTDQFLTSVATRTRDTDADYTRVGSPYSLRYAVNPGALSGLGPSFVFSAASAVFYPDVAPGFAFYTARVGMKFRKFSNGSMSVALEQMFTPAGPGISRPLVPSLAATFVSPDWNRLVPTSSPAVQLGVFVDLSLPAVDMTPYTGAGVRIVISAIANDLDVNLSDAMLVRAPVLPEGFTEFSFANALWQEVNRQLALRSDPLKSYKAALRDLYRQDGTAFPYDQLQIGRKAALTSRALAIAAATAEIIGIRLNHLVLADSEIEFSNKPRELTELIGGTVSLSGAAISSGLAPTPSTGGAPTISPGSGQPVGGTGPSTGVGGKSTFPIPFQIAGILGEQELTNLPSATSERFQAVRTEVDLTGAESLKGVVPLFLEGSSGSALAIQFSDDDSANWRGPDGVIDSTVGLVLIDTIPTGIVAKSIAQIPIDGILRKPGILTRLVEFGGDGATTPIVGNVIFWVVTSGAAAAASTATPGVPITPPVVGCPLSGFEFQSDDFAGGSSGAGSPFPDYADGAAPDGDPGPWTAFEVFNDWWAPLLRAYGQSNLYGTREFTATEAFPDMQFDDTVLFDGHRTLKGLYGRTGGRNYTGCGWWNDFAVITAGTGYSDWDDFPVISKSNWWARLRLKIETGFAVDAGSTTAQTGLTLLWGGGVGNVFLGIRQGKIKADLYNGSTFTTVDVGDESLLIGAAGFKELILRFWAVNATTWGVKVWVCDACDSAGQEPLLDTTITVGSTAAGANFCDRLNYTFDYTTMTTPKAVWVADWENVDGTSESNPFGVASPA